MLSVADKIKIKKYRRKWSSAGSLEAVGEEVKRRHEEVLLQHLLCLGSAAPEQVMEEGYFAGTTSSCF